jgi:hypothetical protein
VNGEKGQGLPWPVVPAVTAYLVVAKLSHDGRLLQKLDACVR